MKVILTLTDDEFKAILPHLYVIRSEGEPIGYRWVHFEDRTENYLDMTLRQSDALHDFAKRSPVVERVLESVHAREMAAVS